MEFKGTKGKWYQSHRKNDEDGMYSTQVYCENGNTIADISWYPTPKEKGIFKGEPVIITRTYRDANAQLISKAPEMLEMLKELLPVVNSVEGHGETVKEIEQLIKEATEIKVRNYEVH